MKKGQSYTTNQILKFADDNNYDVQDYGNAAVGEGFTVLKHNEKDLTISFVLNGANDSDFLYECIYSDIVFATM